MRDEPPAGDPAAQGVAGPLSPGPFSPGPVRPNGTAVVAAPVAVPRAPGPIVLTELEGGGPVEPLRVIGGGDCSAGHEYGAGSFCLRCGEAKAPPAAAAPPPMVGPSRHHRWLPWSRPHFQFAPFEPPRPEEAMRARRHEAPVTTAEAVAPAESAPGPAPGVAAPPARTGRPAPPSEVDALKAGLARPPKPAVALWLTLVAGLAALATVLVLLRAPIASTVDRVLVGIGVRQGQTYALLPVKSVWAIQIVPGRSGRYVADGLATTYWAYDAASVPPLGMENPTSIVLDLPDGHALDQIGVSSGIQNGDAPFNANPRPKEVRVIVSQCATGATGPFQQTITLVDKPDFTRYPLRLPGPCTRVMLTVESVYPSLRSLTGSVTSTTLAGDVATSPASTIPPVLVPTTGTVLSSWVALTEVELFERNR